tara:strand:- start:1817 stop:2290 length:474 start_codon:yes stop_codon:yes gene_type:complete
MVYEITHSEEEILNQLSKLQPLKYNQFYWWRRWGAKNKALHKYCPLLDRIKNGDFDFSPYFWQAIYCELEINKKLDELGDFEILRENHAVDFARRKRLWEDFDKDEAERLQTIQKSFLKEFRITEEELEKELSEFDGTLEELYHHCSVVYKTKSLRK